MGCTRRKSYTSFQKGMLSCIKIANIPDQLQTSRTQGLTVMELIVASVVIYAVGCMAVKSTLLVLYLRIFSPHPYARAPVRGGLAFIIVFYIISVIVTLATCVPRTGEGGWSMLASASDQRCLEKDSRFAEAQGIVGALTDLYVWAVPMPLLAQLRLSTRRKLGVYGVFVAGFL